MNQEIFIKLLEIIIEVLEAMGIIIITIGALRAFWGYLKAHLNSDSYTVKHQLVEAMAMGLEFKLAAEILKTTIVQSIEEIAVLGAIFILRALMTVIINWEIKQEKHREASVEDKTPKVETNE